MNSFNRTFSCVGNLSRFWWCKKNSFALEVAKTSFSVSFVVPSFHISTKYVDIAITAASLFNIDLCNYLLPTL